MSVTFGHAYTPEEFSSVAEERFSSLDVDTVLELFHEDAILINTSGTVHRGKAAIAFELTNFFSLGFKVESVERHLFVSGDIASLISDWSMEGTAPDGTEVKLNGSSSDVLRQGADGVWRYFIDNPSGTARRDPS